MEPDLAQLMRLMRSVMRYPGSAAKRGVQARLDVVGRYHPRVVAAGLEARLKNIERGLGPAHPPATTTKKKAERSGPGASQKNT